MTGQRMTDPVQTKISDMVKAMGPMLVDESPFKHCGVETDKHKGVKRFKPRSSQGTNDGSFRVGRCHSGIIYHVDNDYESVIELWLDENPQILNQSSAWAVYISCTKRNVDYDDELMDALEQILKSRHPDEWIDEQQ